MSLVKTSIPLYPMNLWILLEKRKVYRQRMKVTMIDMRIIIFCSIFSVLPIRTITVLMAPGPVRRGRPIGNTQISSRSWDCEISSSVMLSLEILACIISKAMLKSSIPPATLNESTLMLNSSSIMLPVTAKKRAIRQASVTDFLQFDFFLHESSCWSGR